MKHVVYITDKAGTGHGSGLWFGNGLVLTANHVATAFTDLMVSARPKGEQRPATILWTSKRYDVAVLEVPELGSAPALNLRCDRALEPGEGVYYTGYPGDFTLAARYWARVTRVNGNDPDDTGPLWADVSMIGLSIIPGNSGGPVYDEADHVVGIAVGGIRGQPVGIIVPARVLCKLGLR